MYSLIGSGCTQGSTVETYQKTWIQTIQNRDFPQNQRGKNSIAIIEVNCTMAKKKGKGTSNKPALASVGTTNGKHHISRKNPEKRKEEQEERQRILRKTRRRGRRSWQNTKKRTVVLETLLTLGHSDHLENITCLPMAMVAR